MDTHVGLNQAIDARNATKRLAFAISVGNDQEAKRHMDEILRHLAAIGLARGWGSTLAD